MKYILTLFLFVSCASNLDCQHENISTNRNDWVTAHKVFDSINRHRMSIELKELEFDYNLATSLSVKHSTYLAENRTLNHNGFSERFEAILCDGATIVGENVAYGYTDIDKLMKAWLNSEHHKRNIEGNYNNIGVGIIKDSLGKRYYTTLFYR